jgi:hypothetical protein
LTYAYLGIIAFVCICGKINGMFDAAKRPKIDKPAVGRLVAHGLSDVDAALGTYACVYVFLYVCLLV